MEGSEQGGTRSTLVTWSKLPPAHPLPPEPLGVNTGSLAPCACSFLGGLFLGSGSALSLRELPVPWVCCTRARDSVRQQVSGSAGRPLGVP